MRICILDGRKIRDRKMLHDTLAGELGLPDWYGRNLDALFDCLTDVSEETYIRIEAEEELERVLGRYAGALKKALQRAAEENVQVRFETECNYSAL